MVIGAGEAPAVMAVVPISSNGSPASMDSATIGILRGCRGVPALIGRCTSPLPPQVRQGTPSRIVSARAFRRGWTERSLLYLAAHMGGGRRLGIAEIAVD